MLEAGVKKERKDLGNSRIRSLFSGQSFRTIILSALLLFLVIAALTVMKSARDALVLTQFPGESLPYFMVVTTLVIGVVVALQLKLNEKLSVCRVLAGALLFFAIGTFALRFGTRAGWWAAVPLFYVWVGLFGTQIPMLGWSIISRRLHVRDAKRAIGIIGGGGVAGSIAGGLIAERVSRLGNTTDLLAVAGLLIMVTLIPAAGLGLCPGVQTGEDRDNAVGRPLRHRFVTIVLLVVATGSIVSTFAEFQFKIIAQRELTTEQSLTSFFGWFYAYLGVATLAFQVAVTPLVIGRLGITTGLAILPLALLTGNGLVLGFGTLWSAVFLRAGEQLFKHSIDRSSLEVLYTAIAGKARIRLKSLVEAFGIRGAESLAAILLIVLFSIGGLGLTVIALLSLVLSFVWFGGAILLRREYSEILSQAIEREDVNIDEIKSALFGPEFNKLLPQLVLTASSQTWLHLLDLLETGNQKQLAPPVSLLLEHPDPAVRGKALRLLFSQKDDYSHEVEKLLTDVDRSVRSEAIRYLCMHSQEPRDRLLQFFQDPDPSVQVAACSCSFLLEEDDPAEMALRKLTDILNRSYQPDRPVIRQEIAYVLRNFDTGDSYQEIARRLLQDASLEVRRAALQSVSPRRFEGLLPALLSNVKEPTLWADLRGLLAEFGALILPHVRRLMEQADTPIELKKLLLQVLSDIGDLESLGLLTEYAASPNLVVRFEAIRGLNRLNHRQGLNGFRQRILVLLDQEINELEEYGRQSTLFASPSSLIGRLVGQRRRWAEERVFRLLGLIYDQHTVHKAYWAFAEGGAHLMQTALELLDNLLIHEHKRRIIPVLENQRKNVYRKASPEERKEMVLRFIRQNDQLAAAAALANLETEELRSWQSDLETALRPWKDQSIVEETLQWRYRQMAESSTDLESLTTIQKLESLSRVDIFSRLGPHELLLLANSSVVQDYAPGEVIYRYGEEAHNIYSVIKGKVQLRREPDHIEEIHPGGSFGALSVLSRQPRFFTAVAVESARCIKVGREEFWEMVADYPSASRAIFEVLSGRILTMMGRLSKEKRDQRRT